MCAICIYGERKTRRDNMRETEKEIEREKENDAYVYRERRREKDT